jgi:hypothetical protein
LHNTTELLFIVNELITVFILVLLHISTSLVTVSYRKMANKGSLEREQCAETKTKEGNEVRQRFKNRD